RAIAGAFKLLLKDLDIVDYIASTSRTEGLRVFTDEYISLAPDASQRAAYSIFVPQGSIEKFDQYVPREATDFSVSTGADWKAAYKWIQKFVQDLPDGEQHWERWQEIQREFGFNVEKDVLSWLGAGTVSVSIKSSNLMIG